MSVVITVWQVLIKQDQDGLKSVCGQGPLLTVMFCFTATSLSVDRGQVIEPPGFEVDTSNQDENGCDCEVPEGSE